MEPLAFVEILGRHNDVLARHPVHRWPARVGRGYDMDVILDDRFAAPRHIEINAAADGRFAVSDLQSVNGMLVSPSAKRVAAAEIGPDDIVRIGRTQIRVRPPSHAVPPERPLRPAAIYRRPAAFALAAALLSGLLIWNTWIMSTPGDDRALLLFSMVPLLVAAGVWISVWSLVGRTVGGRSNFAAHGFIACTGIIALALVDASFEYLSFGFDARWINYFGMVAGAATLAYMVYRHLKLNSRAERARLGSYAVIVSALVYSGATAYHIASESVRQGMQHYNAALKAPALLVISGVTPEAFFAEAARLKGKVDAMARAEP